MLHRARYGIHGPMAHQQRTLPSFHTLQFQFVPRLGTLIASVVIGLSLSSFAATVTETPVRESVLRQSEGRSQDLVFRPFD